MVFDVNSTELDNVSVKRLGKFDGAGRWYPNGDVAEYFTHIRLPSRAFPYSYYKAAMTKKFCKWLRENQPQYFKGMDK